jgi:hypothetical protein
MPRIKARAIWVMAFVLLAVIGIALAFWRLWPAQEQSLILPDGSKLTLLRVTYGTNHVCRYETGWQEWLYPLLPKSLKPNLSPREATFSTAENTLMVWFRDDGTHHINQPFVAVIDEYGVESSLFRSPNYTRTLNAGRKQSGTGGGVVVSLAGPHISGWNLDSHPRRSKSFNVVIYSRERNGEPVRVGQFSIRNPAANDTQAWTAEPLPLTRETNGLEITLAQFETGRVEERLDSVLENLDAKYCSRASFQLKENGEAADNWTVNGINARNSSGEILRPQSFVPRWRNGRLVVDFRGGLWLDEPAWKLNVDFQRTAGFPPEELWSINGVGVPPGSEIAATNVVVEKSGKKFEFLGVSGPGAKLAEPYTGIEPIANIHVRTPYLLDGWRIALVEVRDNRGQKARLEDYIRTASVGSGGATYKQMLHGFSFEIPQGVKTLDITFAITPMRHVQFVAKPTLFKPSE